ncbi:EamA family transporter [Aquibacillus halophilus]|uniref:EamA family transporter n=1 Tax=Aquibacillus halophilus TaxID=930132 RepID=A0A6A8DCZ5_9BACI|nr:DMT family transporter [Aquibacillus halophilus]MRH41749.1 EamA family transporter [Aquibacillus halophilus]
MNKKALLFALITITIWGSTFAAIRASLHGGYSPGHLVLTRFLIASAIFAGYSMLPNAHFKIPRKDDFFRILILGLIGISTYHIALTFGEQTVSAGTAGMFIGTAPIFTALIAVLVLKERLGIIGWVGLGIGFTGIIIITLGTSNSSFQVSNGAYLVMLAALATSVFFVFQKPLYARYKPIELAAYFTWAGTLPMLFFAPGLFGTIQQATMEANISALYTGIFPAAIAYALWGTALSLGKASSVTSTMYIEPVIAIVVAWIWLKEFPSTLSIIGGTIAIASVIVVNLVGKKRRVIVKELEAG